MDTDQKPITEPSQSTPKRKTPNRFAAHRFYTHKSGVQREEVPWAWLSGVLSIMIFW